MFEHRGVVVTGADFQGVDWIGRVSELQLNTLGLHSGGGAAHEVIETLGVLGTAAFREKVAAAGLEWEYECHVSESLLPRRRFRDAPEWFRLDGVTGCREPTGNWCASSPEAMAEIRRNGAALAARLPASTHRYFFWGADDAGSFCHCPDCAGLTVSDQNLLGMNALARGVREADPAGTAAYLGYFALLEAPREVRPEPNVILEYAPMHRCYRHALDDAGCAVNRRYFRQLLALLEVFEPARAHVLEYYLDSSSFSNFRRPAVRPDFHREVVKRDLARYHSLGIRSLTTFAVYCDGDYFARHGDCELREYAELLNSF